MQGMEDVVIVNRLQEWRKCRGFTQQSLSNKTGIPLSTIQKLEVEDRDIAKVGAKILLVLSRVLDVSMEQLITKDGAA